MSEERDEYLYAREKIKKIIKELEELKDLPFLNP